MVFGLPWFGVPLKRVSPENKLQIKMYGNSYLVFLMFRCCSSEVLSYSFPKIIWADQNRNKKNPLQAAIAKMNNQDSESNDIRRFEALRNELIELEKRVQRSTDDAENEEVSLFNMVV